MEAFIEYRTLNKEDVTDIYLAFVAAFRDYPYPVNLTLEDFIRKFIDRLSLHFDLSAAAFYNGKVIGFSLASAYDSVVYLSCTATRPEWRNKKVLSELLKFQLDHQRKLGYTQCILDVLITNQRAIRLYEKLGFVGVRNLLTLRAPVRKSHRVSPDIYKTENIPWKVMSTWATCEFPFLNSEHIIRPPYSHDMTCMYADGKGPGGVIIFNPDNGRISQLIIRPDLCGNGLATALLHQALNEMKSDFALFLNMPAAISALNQFLVKWGFTVYSEQLEMKKSF